MKKPILALLLAACSASPSLAAEPSKPNVIVILADDLGYGVLNSYGGDSKRVATPNIDRLATEGAKFSNGYVTCSVCGPSRSALMTGRYQQRFGIYANCDLQSKDSGVPSDQKMMPGYFKDAGYRTAMIGKWHLGTKSAGQHPLEKGFDEYFGFDSSQTDYFKSPILNEGRTKIGKHDYLTRSFTDRAIQFIEKEGNEPFFVYLAYNAVHGPNQAPKETIQRFAHLPEKEAMQAAMVAELDDGVGKLLQALEKSGEDKDTLIFFLSDNGGLHNWWQGSNGNLRGFKRFQFDGGNKVPFIVRWPASVPAGQVRNQITNSLDILPTALEAAGITAPKDAILDGVSLLPSLKEKTDLHPDRPLFWAGSHYEKSVTPSTVGHDNPPPAWAIRRGDWKLMQIMEQGEPMLFNLTEDPAEAKDLIKTHPEVAADLRKTWIEWFKVGAKPIAWKTEHFQQLKSLTSTATATFPKDGLVLHLDATTLPAGAVKQWDDLSGKAQHAVAKEKAPQRLDGSPALVRFEDSALSVAGPYAGKRSVTVFAVARRTAEQAGGKQWQRLIGDATPSKKDVGLNRLRMSAPAEKGLPDPFPLAVMTRIFRDVEPGEFYIGGGIGGAPLKADIAEMLVYDHAFEDPAGYEQVVNYLCKKWSVKVIEGRDCWERFGPTPAATQAQNKALPLMDQANEGKWQPLPAVTDEFDGQALDANKWWDNNPTWYGRPPAPYLPENVAVKDGELQLTLKKDDSVESFTRYPTQEIPYAGYSAASVTSRSVMAYGCYEIRAKVAHFGGTSAWWFVGQSKNAAGQIHKTEIDVFELPPGAPGHANRFGMNMHVFNRGDDHTHLANYANWEAPFVWSEDFHTINLVWSPEWIRYYVDGHIVRTARNTDWHHPLQMIFDMEIMSWLPFPPAEQFPATFRVDYVRGWTRADWPQPQGWTPTIDPTKETSTTLDTRSHFKLVKPKAKATPSAAKNAPNILWIVTDDQRADSIAAFNRMRLKQDDSPLGKVMSPNVDRLAKMGTTFINTFNNNPSCAPSRTIMHTGRYSHRTGVYGFEYYNPTGQPNWRPMTPEILRDAAGYQTLTVGKLGVRAQHFSGKKSGTRPPLYQVDLGYRKEFAAKGLVDWNSDAPWVGGKQGPKVERYYFSDGKVLEWPKDAAAKTNDSVEIGKRLEMFRDYRPAGDVAGANDDGEVGGEILGGVNPQSGDKTRDGNFLAALLEYLRHPDATYTNLLGTKLSGPKGSQPLFIHCGFEFPHTPVLPPAEFRSKFREFRYQVPKFTPEELAGFSPAIAKLYQMAGSDHFTDAEKQQMIADYFAYCAYGDSLVGKMVDGFIEYSEKHQRPWLVLYVCGDHGWRLNEHGMIKKFAVFDTDLRNPIIALSSDKTKFPAGKVVSDFTGFVDMAPTFLSAAGIDVSAPDYQYLDGHDLAKVAGGTAPPRDYIIAEPTWVIGPCALIRTKDYKFAMKVRPQSGNGFTPANAGKNMNWAIDADLKDIGPMLFDLRLDPDETRNVAFDPHYRPVLDALRTKLQNIVLGDGRVEVAWTKEGGDKVHESNFAPGADDGKLALPELAAKAK